MKDLHLERGIKWKLRESDFVGDYTSIHCIYICHAEAARERLIPLKLSLISE